MSPEIVAFLLIAIGVLIVVVIAPVVPRGGGLLMALGIFAIFYGALWIGRQEDSMQWLVNILQLPQIDVG